MISNQPVITCRLRHFIRATNPKSLITLACFKLINTLPVIYFVLIIPLEMCVNTCWGFRTCDDRPPTHGGSSEKIMALSMVVTR